MATWKGLIFDPASALEDPLSGPDVIRNVAVSRDSRQIYMTRAPTKATSGWHKSSELSPRILVADRRLETS
jgi:hypothetical protein